MDDKKIMEFAHAKLTRNDFKDEIRSFTNCLCKMGSELTKGVNLLKAEDEKRNMVAKEILNGINIRIYKKRTEIPEPSRYN